MRRREFVAAAGLAAAALSGCTGGSEGGTAGSDTETTQSETETETVSADSVEFPEGVSENGIDDPDAVIERTVEVIAESGARIEYDELIDHHSYVSSEHDLRVDPESRELLLNEENFQDVESGEVTGEYRLYASKEREEAYDYQMEGGLGGYGELPKVLELNFDEVVRELSTSTSSGLGNVRGFEYAFDGATRQDGDVILAFEALRTTDELEFSSSLEESEYSLEQGELRVRGDGAVDGYEFTLVDGEGRNYEMSLRTEFGTPEIRRPDWVDEAKEEV